MRLYVTNAEVVFGDEAALRLYGRDENGRSWPITVTGLRPYFYANTDDVIEQQDVLSSNRDIVCLTPGYTSLFGDRVTKVEFLKTDTAKEIRELFEETYEADVWYSSRFRIDLGIYTGVEIPDGKTEVDYSELQAVDFVQDFRVLTYDIETDDRGAFSTEGDKSILSIVGHDSYTDEYTGFVYLPEGQSIEEALPNGLPAGFDSLNYYDDEASMLRAFRDYVHEIDPDLWTGWNVDSFDSVVLLRRMNVLGVNTAKLSREGWCGVQNFRGNDLARIRGRTVYDMLPAYKATKRGELKSYKLDSVAEAELGENKIDHTGESIWEMWNENLDLLLRYNLHDVRLVVEIDRKANIIGFRRSIAHAVGSDIAEAQNNNDFIKMMVRRKLFDKGLIGPTSRHEKKEKKYEGGHVHDAYCGVAENVVGMDLESLYPMTMWMLNASPEVRVDESYEGPVACAPNGARFRLDEVGLFAELVDEALELKAEAKAARNAATDDNERKKLSEEYDVRKTIVNSLYGVIGWEHFFLYDELTAEAVTTMGQAVIKKTTEFLNTQEVAEVIYGDTDSNYVRFPESWSQDHVLEAAGRLRRELNEVIYPALASEWGMGGRECRFNIEVESFAPKFFQYGKKKKYAMHVTWKDGKETDKLKIVGMHSNRSDVAELTEKLQKRVLESILGVRDEEVAEIVFAAGKELSTGRDLESMGIPTAVGKPLNEYSESTIQRKVVQFSNAVLGTNFGQGSKPKRVYVQAGTIPEYPEVDVLGFEDAEEFPENIRIDSGRMIQTLIVNPLTPILEAVDIDPDAALKGQVQKDLSAFF